MELNIYCGKQETSMRLIPLKEDSEIGIINNFWSDESAVY